MSNIIAKNENEHEKALQNLILNGDLTGRTDSEIMSLFVKMCASLGLNPLTQPFQVITLKGKRKIYATKDCTDQLRKIHQISITESKIENLDNLIFCRVTGNLGERQDTAIGVVPCENCTGENLANAFMKAETKAKRRLTLSICGLGFLDESETESIIQAEQQEQSEEPEKREILIQIKKILTTANGFTLQEIKDGKPQATDLQLDLQTLQDRLYTLETKVYDFKQSQK